MNLDLYLKCALDACEEASKAIISERKNLKIWEKEDKSKVSSADIASNEILIQKLSSTDLKIFSEEKILAFEERKNLEYFWIIDPLDGTSGFLKGSDEFCIMISLIHFQRPVLSLIKNPSTDDIYYAHKDTQVFKNHSILKKNQEIYNLNKYTALLSVNHLNPLDEEFAKKHHLKGINISSGLKFCALLEGNAGIYRRNESLKIWDIVAGDFLLNQNGGFMADLNSKPIYYNQENFKAPPFIAVSDKTFLKDFL